MLNYPDSIRELGYRYRRSQGIKPIQYPQLQKRIKETREALIGYREWHSKYGDLDLRPWSKHLQLDLIDQFKCAWLNYYGQDAANELKQFYHKEILDMAMPLIAVIMIIYTKDPFKYEKIFLSVAGGTHSFISGNPVKDWENAMKTIKDFSPDEIIYHDSCQMFVIDSGYTYAFDLHRKLVKVEHE